MICFISYTLRLLYYVISAFLLDYYHSNHFIIVGIEVIFHLRYIFFCGKKNTYG
jgi:hypothetical protein